MNSFTFNMLFACTLMALVLAIIFVILDVTKKVVLIGLSPDMALSKRHGIAWVKSIDGGIVQQSFLADRPEYLVKPSWLTVRSMFEQLTKMGLYPENLELLVGNKVIVYKFGNMFPIFTQ